MRLYDVPGILSRMAELAAGHTGRKAIVADGYLLINISVGKIIGTLRHGANEHADGLVGPETIDVLADAHDRGIETQRDLPAVGWQVVRDRVLNDLEQFLLRVRGLNREPVEQLHHETGEPLEGPGNPD